MRENEGSLPEHHKYLNFAKYQTHLSFKGDSNYQRLGFPTEVTYAIIKNKQLIFPLKAYFVFGI